MSKAGAVLGRRPQLNSEVLMKAQGLALKPRKVLVWGRTRGGNWRGKPGSGVRVCSAPTPRGRGRPSPWWAWGLLRALATVHL